MEEIFEGVQYHLKKAGRAGKLPGGVVLVGGGAKLKHITEYAKESLGLAARLGQASGFGGVADDIDKLEYATAIGLMLIDAEQATVPGKHHTPKFKAPSSKEVKGKLSKLFGLFRP